MKADKLTKVLVVGALGNCAVCTFQNKWRRADVLIQGTGYCSEHGKMAMGLLRDDAASIEYTVSQGRKV